MRYPFRRTSWRRMQPIAFHVCYMVTCARRMNHLIALISSIPLHDRMLKLIGCCCGRYPEANPPDPWSNFAELMLRNWNPEAGRNRPPSDESSFLGDAKRIVTRSVLHWTGQARGRRWRICPPLVASLRAALPQTPVQAGTL